MNGEEKLLVVMQSRKTPEIVFLFFMETNILFLLRSGAKFIKLVQKVSQTYFYAFLNILFLLVGKIYMITIHLKAITQFVGNIFQKHQELNNKKVLWKQFKR